MGLKEVPLIRKYEFYKIPEPAPGCTYGKYWNYRIRSHGRSVFKMAIQAHWSELGDDPWNGHEEE